MRSIAVSLVVSLLLSLPLFAAPEAWQSLPAPVAAKLEGTSVSLYELRQDGTEIAHSQGDLVETTPLRIASVTKTFVAATALRLVEDGKLDLSKPMTAYVDSAYTDILREDGYDVDAITVKQLMSHTGGLTDHAQTKTFFDIIVEDPSHVWTREQAFRGAVDWSDPKGAPGEKFSYSDTGYILLGHIIEKLTGQSLASSVRTLLGLDEIGMPDTYWELVEENEGAERRRAHQMLNGMDTHSWSATLDHYGGGGLVSSTRDMARFFKALFGGKVFKHPETLKLMLSKDGLPDESPYRLGIFVKEEQGVTYYEHSGFWGTIVLYIPSSGRTLSGAVLDQAHFKTMREGLMYAVTMDK